MKKVLAQHQLFVVFLVLFLVIATVDILNLDRSMYSLLCNAVSPISGSVCATFYDLPIWQVYLSLAILAALYHLHGEVRTTNRHLANRK
jgi:hypothetical protein